jgi:hypothetical protein
MEENSKHKLPVYVTISGDVTITGSYCLLKVEWSGKTEMVILSMSK